MLLHMVLIIMQIYTLRNIILDTVKCHLLYLFLMIVMISSRIPERLIRIHLSEFRLNTPKLRLAAQDSC